MKQLKHPDMVSVHLSARTKKLVDGVCQARGMTLKRLLGHLVTRFVALDKTEQSIVLGQVEDADREALARLVIARRAQKTARPPAGQRDRKPQTDGDRPGRA